MYILDYPTMVQDHTRNPFMVLWECYQTLYERFINSDECAMESVLVDLKENVSDIKQYINNNNNEIDENGLHAISAFVWLTWISLIPTFSSKLKET